MESSEELDELAKGTRYQMIATQLAKLTHKKKKYEEYEVAPGIFFDRKGRSITRLSEWSRLFMDRDYQYVQKTTVHEITISTVWSGTSMGLDPARPEAIFETALMWTRREPDENGRTVEIFIQETYDTEEQALAGHEMYVQQVTELSESATEVLRRFGAPGTEG